jgi:hypothetical protein
MVGGIPPDSTESDFFLPAWIPHKWFGRNALQARESDERSSLAEKPGCDEICHHYSTRSLHN